MKKIAVPTDNSGMLDGHFGHCKFFTIIDVKNEEIVSEEKIVPPPHEPGLLPRWLAEQKVTDILAGGMGNRAIQIFNQNGVNVFVGAPKMNATELVKGFTDNSIEFSANYCDH